MCAVHRSEYRPAFRSDHLLNSAGVTVVIVAITRSIVRQCWTILEPPHSLLLRSYSSMSRHLFMQKFAIVCMLSFTTIEVVSADEPRPVVEINTVEKKQQKFFHTKVLPLLQARCFECHDRSDEVAEIEELGGSLLLSSRKAMLVGGDTGPAIVPGSPDESLLIQAIRYDGYEMPPRSKMPVEEIQILEKWVKEGAYFPKELDSAPEFQVSEFPLDQRAEDHWAWHFHPDAVQVPDSTGDWAKTDIDRYVMKGLEQHGLQPAAEVDRTTLIRRLSFDITGLPPSIADIEAFTNDPAATEQAVATVVDRLLASPAFGEHWGRHWLDLVRYADTLGHEFDYALPDAWKYRDYVIRAFNEDVPYDQFVKEHVAGDLLTNPRQHVQQKYNESIIGTGFWFLHEDKHAPVDVKAEEAAIIDNQIDVFSKTFLGMTLACARCHDHKFDAISTADYYAMAGYLQSSHRQAAWLDPGQQIKQKLKEVAELKSATLHQLDQIAESKVIQTETADYLSAAVLALNAETDSALPIFDRSHAARPAAKPDVLFADFEDQAFSGGQPAGWIPKGDAFAKGPIEGAGSPSQKLTGVLGKRTANSFAGTDALKGSLTSTPFVINHSGISFLIAGGSSAENVGIKLLIDGQVVRSAAGERSDQLKRKRWIVEDFIGQTAILKIEDRSTGRWGHVVVDDIRFIDVDQSLPLARDIKQLADHFQLNSKTLRKWIRLLHESRFETTPMVLQDAVRFANLCSKQPLKQAVKTFRDVNLSKANVRQQLAESAQVLGDFSCGVPDGWSTSGQAFDTDADGTGTLWFDAHPLIENECVSSASLSVNQRGSLFSPTFILEGDQILVQIAGEAAGLRLVVDGYIMHEFNSLLFNGMKASVDTDGEFRWISLAGDTGRYAGHKAHLEIRDDNDGWFAVRQVIMPHHGQSHAVKKLLNAETAFSVNTSASNSAWNEGSELKLNALIKSLVPDSNIAARSQLLWLQQNGLLQGQNDGQLKLHLESWSTKAKQVAAPVSVMAMMDGSPENERVFIRGNHKSLGEEVPRNILTALRLTDTDLQQATSSTVSSHDMEGSGRLQLAMKLVDRQNPLTARVAVNRIWHHLFGKGLVASTDNFGLMGSKPTHPKLLDYLAVKFMDQGWSMKTAIRNMVLSRTYRLQSMSPKANERLDPTNQYLHRASIRRLSAESIRDTMLAVSGELNDEQFGKPIPTHLTAFMQGRGRPGSNGPLDGHGRRSIYLKINRNFLSPMMTAFDSPTPFTTIGRRNISNVPAQALILLNNQFITEMTKRWAEKLLAEDTTIEEKLRKAWRQLYGFKPNSNELAPLLKYASDAAEPFNQDAKKASGDTAKSDSEVVVLSDLLHVLVNGKQFLYLR